MLSRYRRHAHACSPNAPAAATSSISPGSASELARYGLSIDEAQTIVQYAIGGENVTTTVEGRERYPVNVRYMRDFRSDFDALGGCRSRRRRPAADPARAACDGRRRRPVRR